MPVLQPMPRKSLVKGAALARRLNAAATPATSGTALYPDLTESVVERTDDNGDTYYLVASECAEHRYYGVRMTENGWITSTDTERLAKKLIAKVEQYIQEREVAQAASQPAVKAVKKQEMTLEEMQAHILFYAYDDRGLYACVKSARHARRTYRVGIDKATLYTQTCRCDATGDCWHRAIVDYDMVELRPTFKQRLAGEQVSQATINTLLYRHTKPIQQAA